MVKQHIELEKLGFCPGDGASRLRFGSATARQPYQFGTTWSRPTRHRRGSAYRREMVGMDRRAVRLLRRSRLCQTTRRTRKYRRPPGRRRCAPEVWADTEVSPPIHRGAATPIEKSAGGMTSVSSDFPRAPARPCQTTRRTRKDRRPPGRRRCAPEIWVGDGAPTLPFGNDGVAPSARMARQLLSKRDGLDGPTGIAPREPSTPPDMRFSASGG